MIYSLGPGTFLAKIDIKHAFRLCPVRVQDFPLLGMVWRGQYYVDTRLPFGSRSSPYIFNTFADFLCWCIVYLCCIQYTLHYLDDFITAHMNEACCSRNVSTILKLFQFLGVPIALDKLEGPSTTLTYLGIEIDTVAQIIRLPKDKVVDLRILLQSFMGKLTCSKRELLQLISKLSFAAKVVKPGRLFLRRLINLSTTKKGLHEIIVLDSESRNDVNWWHQAMYNFNGTSFIPPPFVTSPQIEFFTDASGTGFGGVFGTHWFVHTWPDKFKNKSINFKELFAVTVAFILWKRFLVNKQIKIFSDNLVICNLWSSHSVRAPDLLGLIRYLYFQAFENQTNILLLHIPGHRNVYADLLSRLQVSKFRQMYPQADHQAEAIPTHVWDICPL